MPATVTTTTDRLGDTVAIGDLVRVLEITPDRDIDEDLLDMFMDMVGSRCEVERIDEDGTAWVAVWWNGDEGTQVTLVGLTPRQMEKTAG
ncbi:hypothetical protein [Azonexus sp. R2A61]|uniref:hypothetical protein n=1 Tax=Azonexus sp. R2A61 TaxID=2744443 RepID=UPI001F2F0A3C|nr:hypothetical protein [Azonexus sp. R2A61]